MTHTSKQQKSENVVLPIITSPKCQCDVTGHVVILSVVCGSL